jgi:predicted DNA-binding transcriptional regulator AlpA
MTARKSDIPLSSRLTAYVSREHGAAELQVSPSTWDDLVECGQIPPPLRLGKMRAILRWRWADVDKHLSQDKASDSDREAFFRERVNGTAKDGKRHAA